MDASFLRAAPHFLPLAIFPLLAASALYGGWWIAGPFAFLFANSLDPVFGIEERNIDPRQTPEGKLFWFKLSVWIWGALWPVTLAFMLWRIFVAGGLAAWEQVVLVALLAMVAPSVFLVSHEFIHRRAAWERRVAEFLLASVSWPLYAIEHVGIHHARVGTPGDPESAPRGTSFWRFLVSGLPRSLVSAWRYERSRLARGQRSPWHIANAFWRYLTGTAAWYAFGWWMGGWRGALVFLIMGMSVVFQMRISDYIQHYGLRRVRLSNGRFERVQPHHVWSAGYRFTNWLYYNAQRHPDHHAAANRRYPVLQHHGEDTAPQMPGTYGAMMSLAASPRRWFETMNPLVDQYRARFYPEIDDWSVYDSEAFAARPEAFDAIAEILAAAPRLAGFMNRAPKLLDSLEDREFADLDLPDGFGPDPEFERIARRGLARVYWTRELGVDEMKEQIAEIPTQDAGEMAEAAREWCNAKVFQIGIHTIRANLTPAEAGSAVSRVAEAAISAVLAAVCEDVAERSPPQPGSGICAVAFGDLAAAGGILELELDILFLYEGESPQYSVRLLRRFYKALRIFSRGNLLFSAVPRPDTARPIRSLADFRAHHLNAGSPDELQELAGARLVFASGDSDIAGRFKSARSDILMSSSSAHDSLMSGLRQVSRATVEPSLESIRVMRGGLIDVDRAARFLQLKHAGEAPAILGVDTVSVFETAGVHGLISAEAGERLAAAATLWRGLNAILELVADEGFEAETASARVKAVVAEAAGLEDFGELAGQIRETASQAAACIGQIQ